MSFADEEPLVQLENEELPVSAAETTAETISTKKDDSLVTSLSELKVEPAGSPSPTPDPSQMGMQPYDPDDMPCMASVAAAAASPEPVSVSSMSMQPYDPEESEATSAPFDFQKFQKLLKSREADPIVRYIRSFLTQFNQKPWNCRQQVKIIGDFKKFIFEKMHQHEPFRSLNESEFVNAQEGIEKLLMTRLYVKTFSPANPDESHLPDVEQDRRLKDQCAKFQWITGRNLDINDKYIRDRLVKLATAELRKINNYRSPRDKLICILNCCKVIFGIIRQSKLEENADVFVPLLVYVVLRSNVAHLVSNVFYIERFRYELQGEMGYYLSSLLLAINFILELKREALTVSDEEWDAHVKGAAEYDASKKDEELVPQEPETSLDLLKPLDDAAASVLNTIGSFWSNYTEDRVETQEDVGSEVSREEQLAQQLTQREHDSVVETLHEMFPDLDTDIIHDVVRAKEGRVGACVDVLLSFY